MEKRNETGNNRLKRSNNRGKSKKDWKDASVETTPRETSVDEDNTSVFEDVEAQDSRQKRFSSTLEGNRFEELRSLREKEREVAIQNGLIDDPTKPRQLDEAVTFVGTCPDMCPEYEREQREYQNNLERWEINPETGRVDKNLAVKAFHRPAAGNEQALPSDVRPPPVLKKSLDYLVDKIVCGPDPLENTHFFVRDRTRSIRQDFTLQNCRDLDAVACHERIARYHILCIHQLCEKKQFSAQQEVEQLRKVLQSLCEFYDDLRKVKIRCPNEPEFRSYAIITHLRDPDVVRQSQILPIEIFDDQRVQLALRLSALAQKNNERVGHILPRNTEACPNLYTRFFKLVQSPAVTYLMACLLESHFMSIRKGALKAMRKAFMSAHANFPCGDLKRILHFDTVEQAASFSRYYGLEVSDDNGELSINLNKTAFFNDSKPDFRQLFSQTLVESKLQNRSFADIINGSRYNIDQVSPNTAFSTNIPLSLPFANKEPQPIAGFKKNTPETSVVSKNLSTFNGKFNVNAPVFTPRSFPTKPFSATDISAVQPTNLPNGSTNGTETFIPPVQNSITSNKEAVKPIKNKPKPISFESLSAVGNLIISDSLSRIVRQILQNLYTEWVHEKTNLVFATMFRTIFREVLLDGIASEVYLKSLKKHAISQISVRAHHSWVKKQEKMMLEMREKNRQEKYFSVLNSVVKAESSNITRLPIKRTFYGDTRNLDKASEKLRAEHDRTRRLWKPVLMDSLFTNLQKFPVYEDWHLLIFNASTSSMMKTWLCAKFSLKETNKTSFWHSSYNLFNRQYHVDMPDNVSDLPQTSLCYGACVYNVGLLDEEKRKDLANSDLNSSPKLIQGNDSRSAHESSANKLFSFVHDISRLTITKLPLLLIFWSDSNLDMQGITQKYRFLELITSTWSAISSIHVLTITNDRDVDLEHSLKVLLDNVTVEKSPFAQLEELEVVRKKREAEIEASSKKVKRLASNNKFLMDSNVEGLLEAPTSLENSLVEDDKWASLRQKIKTARDLLKKVETFY
ncbi:Nuclear mRNA export factor [Schizosaccharomyces pombe]